MAQHDAGGPHDAASGPSARPGRAPQAPAAAEDRPPHDPIPNGLAVLLGALVLARGLYHLAYLGESEFAAATFSDGRVYFEAARDILAHPPWGSEPFYLQGLYAYFVAAALGAWPTPAAVMFAQLALAGLGLLAFFSAVARVEGRRAAGWATALALASPELAFYENKFLSAELGVAANAFVLLAGARYVVRPSPVRASWLGIAAGVGVLARGNMALALPAVLWAVVRGSGPGRRGAAAAFVLAGAALALAPMMVRNAVVTGRPTVFPAHGGGTSFYIGNNPHSRGVWNTAGGLVTPDVARERDVLAERLGVDPGAGDPAEAVGAALYRRAFEYARDDPLDFVALQLRKVYLLAGNDPLTQDYDWYGEQEMIGPILRWGLPFGVLLALGIVGARHLAARARARPAVGAFGILLLGQAFAVAAANVVFFTSSQHRVPLVLPLAAAAGPLVAALVRRRRPALGPHPRAWWGLGAAVALQAFVPRLPDRRPSAVHYFNLAVVRSQLGLDRKALAAIDEALARRPDHPLIRLERVRLLYALHRWKDAEREGLRLASDPTAPPFARDQARRIVAAARLERALAAPADARGSRGHEEAPGAAAAGGGG